MPKIKDFPELRQTFAYDCGASALQSVLTYYGIDVREEEIMKIAGTNGRSGTSPENIIKTAKHFGLKCKAGKMTLEDLKKCVKSGLPAIIPIQAWESSKINSVKDYWQSGHYVIPVAYDKRKIYFEDPYSSVRTFLTFAGLADRWHDRDKNPAGAYDKYENYGMVFTRQDGRPPVKPRPIHIGRSD